jgi:hypothetical protein
MIREVVQTTAVAELTVESTKNRKVSEKVLPKTGTRLSRMNTFCLTLRWSPYIPLGMLAARK